MEEEIDHNVGGTMDKITHLKNIKATPLQKVYHDANEISIKQATNKPSPNKLPATAAVAT
jgi:hypothetical protein